MSTDPRDEEEAAPEEPVFDEAGGDPACWAGIVCQECGAVVSEGHRPGCPADTDS